MDIDAVIAVAEQTDRIVSRQTLLGAGLKASAIETMIAIGVLKPVLIGIYLVGGMRLTQRQLFRAAVIHAGPGSALSGYSAGEQRRLVRPQHGNAVVSSVRQDTRKRRLRVLLPMDDDRPGYVTIRPTASLAAVEFDGLPVTTITRTLIEIGTSRGRSTAERAWKTADYRQQLNLVEIRDELQTTRRRGAGLVRQLIETMPDPVDQSADVRSPWEVRFLQMVAAAGLPAPEVNVPMVIGGKPYVGDFYYRGLGLVVEVDDPSHRRPVAQGRDKVRDVEFFVAGLDVIRFETHRLDREPSECMTQLGGAIARQARRQAGAADAPPSPTGTQPT